MGLEFIRSVGPEARAAIPALLQATGDSDWWISSSSACALWEIDRQTNVAVRVLAARLESTDASVRKAVADDLRQMGSAGREAAPKLEAMLEDRDHLARVEAEKSLEAVDLERLRSVRQKISAQTTANVERCLKALRTEGSPERFDAIETLAVFGPGAKAAVPALVETLGATNAGVSSQFAGIVLSNRRVETLDTLAEIGPDARAALPLALAQLPQHPYECCKVRQFGSGSPRGSAGLGETAQRPRPGAPFGRRHGVG
jgi:HEAT repeat protein